MFGSNLVLAGGQAGFSTESDAVAPQNQWAILRAAHKLVGQKQKIKSWSGILELMRNCPASPSGYAEASGISIAIYEISA